MVLVVLNVDYIVVEFVIFFEGVVVGERVIFFGYIGELDDVFNFKKKIWESV